MARHVLVATLALASHDEVNGAPLVLGGDVQARRTRRWSKHLLAAVHGKLPAGEVLHSAERSQARQKAVWL